MRRGEVWWVDFGEPTGSAPGFRRPAVIVSSDRFNRSRLATVLVAPVSSNVRLAASPGNVELHAGMAGLSRSSAVNVTGLTSVDRSQLVERSGSVTADVMTDIDDGLRLVLAL